MTRNGPFRIGGNKVRKEGDGSPPVSLFSCPLSITWQTGAKIGPIISLFIACRQSVTIWRQGDRQMGVKTMFARTERLLLRPGWQEDAPALAKAIGEEGVVRNLATAPWAPPPGERREGASPTHPHPPPR